MNLKEVSIVDAIDMIKVYLAAGLVPYIVGSPGVGKSDTVKTIAKQRRLKVIDLRLSQCDPTDLNGFPQTNGKKGTYIPMDTFPLDTDDIPDGYDGWLLFLDEISSATPAIQAAAYKLVLDRQVGLHNLHPKVEIVAAGNKESDNAVVHEMSTALRSRLAWINVRTPTAKEWCEWAMDTDQDHRVISFMNFSPDSLYQFIPEDADEDTFRCPRTWEFMSRVMKNLGDNVPNNLTRIAAGIIGQSGAAEFSAYIRLFSKLPTYEAIVNNPTTAKLPADSGSKYAVSGLISSKLFTENDNDRKKVDAALAKVAEYIDRLDKEYQVVAYKNIKAQGKNRKVFQGISDTPEVLVKWMEANADHLFGD